MNLLSVGYKFFFKKDEKKFAVVSTFYIFAEYL